MARIRVGGGGISSAFDILTSNAFSVGNVVRVQNATTGALQWITPTGGGGGGGPVDTDELAEGSSNLYFTTARARAAISADSNAIVSYASSTGVFTTNTTNLASAVTGAIAAGTGLSATVSSGVKTFTLDIPDGGIDTDMLDTGAVTTAKINTAAYSNKAAAENGTASTSIMSPLRVRQAAEKSIDDLILTGYTADDDGAQAAGTYRIDGQNGTVTINPKTAGSDRANITAFGAAGSNFAVRDGNAEISGIVSTIATDSNSNFVVTLATPFDTRGTPAGGDIIFEQFMAHKIRSTPPGEDLVGIKSLKITGTNANNRFILATGADGLKIANVDSDGISEGSTNLYYTDARADARIAAATTDDLSEGSTNLYFTDARARGAFSASGIVSYTQSTGAFSTDTAALATAIDGILAVSGSAISKAKSGNTITLTVTNTGGGGGGSSTLSGLTDTEIPNTITAGRPLVWNGTSSKWEPALLGGAQISGSSIPITTLSGISANGTDGHLLASNGSGAFKLVAPSGIGISDFTTTAEALVDSDFVLIGDSALKKMTVRNFSSQLRPIHLRTDLSESGYQYKVSGSPAQSHVRLFDSGGNVIIGIVPKTGFELELDEILQQGFLIQIRNADSTKFRYGRVSGRSGTGANNFWLATLDGNFLSSQGTFANDEALIFESFGQFAEISSYANAADAADGTKFDRWMSPRATTTHADAYWRDNLPALQYSAQLSDFLVPGSDAIEGSGDMKINTATRTWTMHLTSSEWNPIDPVLRKGSKFTIIDTSDSSTRQSGVVESVDRTIADSGSDRVVSFVYATGATGNISNNTEIDSVNVVFEAAAAASNRDWMHGTIQAGTGITRSVSNGVLTFSLGSAIPSKASVAEMRTGTDDAKFATALGTKAAIEYARSSDLPEAALTGMELRGSSALSAGNQMKLNQGNFLNVRLTPARYREIAPLLHHGNTVRILNSSGVQQMSATLDRAEEFDISASTDDLVLNLESSGGLSLTATGTDMTLEFRAAWADGWEDAIDAYLTTNLTAGSNVTITHATGTGHGITIAATGGAGGTLTYATDAQALAGTSRDLPVNPANLAAVSRHYSHTTDFPGFQNTSSTGAAMGLGTWNINSNGTVFHCRPHNATEWASVQAEMLVDEDMRMVNATGQAIGFSFSAVTVHAVDGSDIGYLRATIGSHYANPTTPTLTGDWTLHVSPKQNREVLSNAPNDTIPVEALALIPAGRMQGLSAAGNSGIGTTTFGQVSDSVWNSITATTAGLMPIPHPNQSSTPSGTGEVTFNPKSAASTFMCLANVGFGWLGDHNVKVHFCVARKIGNGAWTVIDASKKFNVLNGNYGGVDLNVTPFYVDAPNTANGTNVSYRWMIVRGNVDGNFQNNGRVYPIGQSVAFIEVTNM